MPPMTVTVQNIAKTAGVSRSTAYMILSGNADRYASDTRKRVEHAAQQLGYRPNIGARALSQKRSFLIGAVFNQINGKYAGEYLAGMQDRVLDAGCAPTMLIADEPEAELKALQTMADRRVDGLIVNPIPTDEGNSPVVDAISMMRSAGLPIVEFLGNNCGPDVPKVQIDGYRAGYEIVQATIGLGCPRPMLVIPNKVTPESPRNAMNWFLLDFYRGYEDAVVEGGYKPWYEIYRGGPEWDVDANARAILGEHRPACIITLSRKLISRFAFLGNTEPELVDKDFVLGGVEARLGHVDCRFTKVMVNHMIRAAIRQATDILFSMIGDSDALPGDITLPPTIEVVEPAKRK